MAYSAEIGGEYPVKPGYQFYLYVRRDQTDNANNRSTYAWDCQQRNWATNTPSWVLDTRIWYVVVAGTAWQGYINCDFRGTGYGGARAVATGSGPWVSHDASGYLNVSFACSHVTGYWGTAEASGVLYTDRIPKPPSAPGTPTYSEIQHSSARATWAASDTNNGAAIDHYLLRVSKNSNPEVAPFTDYTVGGTTQVITGLDPGVQYYAKVYAHNSMGYSGGGTSSFKTMSGAYVGKGDAFPGAEVMVGKDGAFVIAEMYVGQGGSFVKAI